MEINSEELQNIAGGALIPTGKSIHCRDCGYISKIYYPQRYDETYEEPDPLMQIGDKISGCKKCHSRNIEVIM